MVSTFDLGEWPSLADLQREEKLGNVSRREHPDLPLYIWNYTPQVQYNYEWNETTSKTRGLVTDESGSVVAPCIPKFYNFIDHDEEWFEGKKIDSITEKIDGSMINIFFYDNQWIASSRGSFESEQARLAQELLGKFDVYNVMLDKRRTYIAELVHPENRIVVDYGTEESLYLLSVFTRGTNGNWHEYPWSYASQFKFNSWISRLPKTYTEDEFNRVLDQGRPNFEGFVVRYTDNSRVKFKLEEYVKLHRVATGVTSKRLAKMWIRRELSEYLTLLPDELYNKVTEVLNVCETIISNRKARLIEEYEQIPHGDSRKDFALAAKESSDPSSMFLLYDDRDEELETRLERWLLDNFETLDIPSLNEDSMFRESRNSNHEDGDSNAPLQKEV